MNSSQSAAERRPQRTASDRQSGTSRSLTPRRRIPSDEVGTAGSRPSSAARAVSHPALKKEPHYASHGAPSSAAKAKGKKKASAAPPPEEDHGGSTVLSSLLKAVIYLMSVLVVAGLLSYYAINIANDVFALVKRDEEIQITISEDMTLKEYGKLLEENGVIEYPSVFAFYADLRGKSPNFAPGDYTVNPSMNYDQLLSTVSQKTAVTRETVVVVIPEGYTVDDIIDTLVNKYGLSSEEELVDAVQNYDFDYWFVDQLENLRDGRKYRLEGYLYPDTYYYYTDASAETIINKMLSNFDTKMKQTFKNAIADGENYVEKINNLCAERGYTFDDIVILASMIQMEAFYDIEYGTISSVFNNRLANPSKTGGLLGSDATIYYILDEHPDTLTQAQLEIDSPYNTRKYAGLPPGSITNPTYLAINYALYPEKTDYYYFVAKKDGYNLFAKTYAQHLKNCEEALADE